MLFQLRQRLDSRHSPSFCNNNNDNHNNNILLGIPKLSCPVCVATVEELYFQLSRFLRSYIVGLASTQSLRPCWSQSDRRLLIYGREKAKCVVASKTELLLFSSNVKVKADFHPVLLVARATICDRLAVWACVLCVIW